MTRRLMFVLLLVALVALDPTAALQKKKKRGIYHGLHGFALAGHGVVPLHGVPSLHKGYHPSPYARFPGLHKGSLGGVLPPGYALFPGGASVASYQRNFPRYPTLYGAGLYPGFGVAPVKPLAGFAPTFATGLTPYAPAPALPAYPAAVPAAVPAAAAFPQAFVPLGAPAASGNTQQTYFATYPQKPLIPVAVPVQPDVPVKVPVVVQKPFYTGFSTVVPNGGLIPGGIYSTGQSVAVSNVQPQFVGIPVATGSASGITPAIATTLSSGTTQVTQAPQQPWRPVVVNQPVPPTPTPPSNAYLPSYATSQGQIYISSTPAPSLHDHHQQQSHHQALLDLDQGSLHQQDGSGAFNGQPYDVASNHGRYTGPSSYDVDITHNGYQKKKK
ncbi:WAS/WASL-interacting protein family member 3-like [Anopheles marshallii]|uniref:WAS/WASL-interacting protein family member 3-like n=1 Tax=Anopheles marshallii TaxID=1521116 RepID=UPI00237A8B6E|nr:WAS/WASL-interacting protein family member 3-like [Anopheles marshallii]